MNIIDICSKLLINDNELISQVKVYQSCVGGNWLIKWCSKIVSTTTNIWIEVYAYLEITIIKILSLNSSLIIIIIINTFRWTSIKTKRDGTNRVINQAKHVIGDMAWKAQINGRPNLRNKPILIMLVK